MPSCLVAPAALAATLLLTLALALPLRLTAQNWERDPTFTPPVFESGSLVNLPQVGLAPLADGRVLIARDGYFVNGQRTAPLLRINTDGSIDPGFAPTSLTGLVRIALVYPDGRVLVTDDSRRLQRLLPTGAVDPAFTIMPLEASTGVVAALTPAGRIWIWGSFRVGTADAHLALLQPDGGWDERFAPLSISTIQIRDGVVQSEDTLTVAGASPLTRAALFRITTRGAIDTSFDASATFPASAEDRPWVLARQPDGSVLAATLRRVARILPGGASDAAFQPTFADPPEGFGRASPSGPLYYYHTRARALFVRRLNPDGSTDAAFVREGDSEVMANSARPYPLTADGQTLYFANAITPERKAARQLVTRTDAAGAIDARFSLRLSLPAELALPVRQPDGKYLVYGDFDHVAGVAYTPNRPNVVRLNRDGSLDRTFRAPPSVIEGSTTYTARPLGVQPSGKILVTMREGVRRLQPDGSLDESFAPIVGSVSLDAQGFLYTQARSEPLQRLTPDGAPDPSSAFPAITASGATVTLEGGAVVHSSPGIGDKLTWVRRDGSISGEATYSYTRPGVTRVVLPDSSVLVIGDLTTPLVNTLAARIHHFDSSGQSRLLADLPNEPLGLAGLLHDALVASGGAHASMDLSFLAARSRAVVSAREMLVLPAYTRSPDPDTYPLARFRPRDAQAPVTSLAPSIYIQPRSRSAAAGSTTLFTVYAHGANPRTYQWFKDGVALGPPAETDFLELRRVQPSDEGLYTVRIVNAHGTVTSIPARLGTLAPPAVTLTGPSSLLVAPGQTVVLTVSVAGDNLRPFYQKDGQSYADPYGPPPGYTIAPGTRSLLLPRITPADTGVYRLSVTNGSLTAASGNMTVSVSATAAPSRLVNLSVRAHAGAGDASLIVGFVVGGAGTPPALLARGIGPALAAFGVTGALADPQLTLRTGATLVAANDDWSGNAQVIAAASATGAFALPDTASRDAALYAPSLATGAYTVQVSGAAGTSGVALAEVYDAGPAAGPRPQLVNLSARSAVTGGAEPLIAGFALAGGVAKTVLVRAVGPSLAAFGVTDHVTRGELALYDSAGRKVAENLEPGFDEVTSLLARQVGAFALQPSAADNALAITLPPGAYTAQFRPADPTRRVVLIEVYEVP